MNQFEIWIWLEFMKPLQHIATTLVQLVGKNWDVFSRGVYRKEAKYCKPQQPTRDEN